MAIQLHEADRSSIFSYVSAEVEMTLFISGDVQCYGVESPTVSVYRIGSWDAVVMLFDDTACLYSRSGSFDVQDVVRLLGDHHIVRVSGKDADIRTLGGAMPLRMKPMTLCQLDRNAPLSGFLNPSVVVRRLSSSDMKENLSLLLGIEEFRDTYQGKDPDREQAQLVKGLAHGDIRFGLYKGGRLCAVAGSTSCGPQSAMLIGVATRKEERGNGYAHAVVTALCQEHFREGRQSVCLFWDNPDAWRMYQRMGFVPVGPFTMAYPLPQ